MISPFFAFGLPAGAEWFWIVLIILLLFGAKKLPELARGLGRSVGEFKRAKDEFDREMADVAETTEVEPSRPPQTLTPPSSQPRTATPPSKEQEQSPSVPSPKEK